MRSLVSFVALTLITLSPIALSAQNSSTVVVDTSHNRPVYRVNVIARTVESVNYHHRASTKIDFHGTNLMPEAHGRAKVVSKAGRMEIHADLDDLGSPSQFGPEYLTYVLWAITPEGRPVNLGEIVPNADHRANIGVTVNLQNFGMIVTAEPYFAVTRPSDMRVMENILRKDTRGWEQPVSARYEATERGEYTVDLQNARLPASMMSSEEIKTTPLSLVEARNAVAIAEAAGAEQYAPEVLARAHDMLHRAEAYYQQDRPVAAVATAARGATEAAEDARVLSVRKRNDEQVAAARRAAEQRAELARQQALSEQQARQQAEENARQAQLQAQQSSQHAQQEREAAERAKAEAEQAQSAAQQAQQQAEAAQQAAREQQEALAAQAMAAQQQAEAARQQALSAEERAKQAEQDKEQARQKLLAQLNEVMQTRDTARGLIVNMNDVLFDFNQATLKPGAKVRLAKIAGILAMYPDLKLQLEGYTDSIGTAEYNQELSDRRAEAVRDFLISQGVRPSSITAQGFGEENPVASNRTDEGRQMNRRVDLVVSGEAISAHTEQSPAVNATTGPASMAQPEGNNQQLQPEKQPLPPKGQETPSSTNNPTVQDEQ